MLPDPPRIPQRKGGNLTPCIIAAIAGDLLLVAKFLTNNYSSFCNSDSNGDRALAAKNQMTITYREYPVTGSLKKNLPLEFKLARQNELEPLWNEFVRSYHYLGHGRMPGANLKYLIFSGDAPLAALSFRAASLKLNSRDSYIGWLVDQRNKHLRELANNNRFLILPWVRVKNLGSFLLSQVTALLVRDWSY